MSIDDGKRLSMQWPPVDDAYLNKLANIEMPDDSKSKLDGRTSYLNKLANIEIPDDSESKLDGRTTYLDKLANIEMPDEPMSRFVSLRDFDVHVDEDEKGDAPGHYLVSSQPPTHNNSSSSSVTSNNRGMWESHSIEEEDPFLFGEVPSNNGPADGDDDPFAEEMKSKCLSFKSKSFVPARVRRQDDPYISVQDPPETESEVSLSSRNDFWGIRETVNKTSTIDSQPALPTIIRATVLADPNSESKIGFMIKRGEYGGVMIYHVDQKSLAATSGLTEGCEILAVNDKPVHNVTQCLAKLLYCTRNGGEASILASEGDRMCGYSYVLVKKTHSKHLSESHDNVTIDGLRLEEKGGKVKIARLPGFPSSSFHGLNVNKGDVICSISGIAICSIPWAKLALKVVAGPIVPILTYNLFRRLRLKVMSLLPVAMKVDGRRETIGSNIKIEDEYDIHETLGEGSFAVVKKVTHRASGETYSVKIVDRASLTMYADRAIKNEIIILKDLNHDHILNLHDEVVTISHYYLVTECLSGGNLFDRIAKKKAYTEREARDLCKTIFDALSYVHSKPRLIAVRDLKPEHLWFNDSQLKISAFGCSKVAADDYSLITLCGTPGYVAPEVLRRTRYGTKADMWSVGVIVFYMIGGYRPFEAHTEQELHRMTKNGKFSFQNSLWDTVSSRAKDMISSLLVTNPGKRASADEILSHPWMKENMVTLQRSNHGVRYIVGAPTLQGRKEF